MIVVAAPVFKDHTAFAQCIEQLPVQTFGPKASVEALRIPVLPRTPGIDVDRLDLVCPQPPPDHLGNELRSVVALQAARNFTGGLGRGNKVTSNNPSQKVDGKQMMKLHR